MAPGIRGKVGTEIYVVMYCEREWKWGSDESGSWGIWNYQNVLHIGSDTDDRSELGERGLGEGRRLNHFLICRLVYSILGLGDKDRALSEKRHEETCCRGQKAKYTFITKEWSDLPNWFFSFESSYIVEAYCMNLPETLSKWRIL